MSQDVDALTEKVTPGKIVERRVDRARDAATRLKEKVMGSDPTVATGPVGTCGGGVRSAASTDGRPGVRHGVVGRLVGAGRRVVRRRAAVAGRRPSTAASTPCSRRPQAIRRQTRGNPLAAGLIAFGAGWLVSSLLPASRREQELADQAKQVAQEKVQPVAAAGGGRGRRTTCGSRRSRPSSR